MQLSNIPTKFQIAFGSSAGGGYIRTIPQGSQIGITNGAASLTDGFPPLCFIATTAGGVPPFGQDFNGLLNQMTQWTIWQQAGGLPIYDSTYVTSISGYPKNAILGAVAGGGIWLNLVDNNSTNPDTGGANWAEILPFTGVTTALTPTFVRFRLTGNLTVYIATTGNDTTGTGTSGNPWATLQHAFNYMQTNYDCDGYTITIQMAAGTYANNLVAAGALVGQNGNNLIIQGNVGSPSTVVLSTGATVCITATFGANIVVQGITLTSTGSSLITGAAMAATNAGSISFTTVVFANAFVHLYTNTGTIYATGNYSITGSATYHAWANFSGLIDTISITVTLTGTPVFTAFANVTAGQFQCYSVTYSGSATGQRYLVSLNGVIYTAGGGANYLPGNSAGTASTGGQYA
jgi:hypothetical protein